MEETGLIVSPDQIQSRLFMIRGERVIIDRDLGDLYGVETGRLNQQVRRNENRFPADFVFKLTKEEKKQVLAAAEHLQPLKYSSALPLAYTERGALMAATVLDSESAENAMVMMIRSFVQIRDQSLTTNELTGGLKFLNQRVAQTEKQQLMLLAMIKDILSPSKEVPVPKKRRIGF
jgi:2,3-bisphosphoglycerate-independent phosphoglycerate mutase